MAEAERAGGVQGDLEKELTCSVSRGSSLWCWRVGCRRIDGCVDEDLQLHDCGRVREHVEIRDWVAPSESLQGSWGPLNDEDAPANPAMFRSVPTSSTSRSPSSTAFTPSAAPA
jgi:hypothetical protein